MRRTLVTLLALGLLLGACGKNSTSTTAAGTTGPTATGPTATETDTETPAGDCGTEASPIAEIPSAVQGFPGIGDMTVTSVEVAGPSTILSGSTDADLDEVFGTFKTAFNQAGYTVTSSEKEEEDDAEVNFSGNSTTGQVKLSVPCEGQTNVAITIRPS